MMSQVAMPTRWVHLPLWARAADAAAIALLLLALFVAIDGGFVLSLRDIRLSVRSEWRVLAWAAALLLVRHLFVREHPLHRSVVEGFWGAARGSGPLRDDSPPGPIEPSVGRKRVTTYAAYAAGVISIYALLTAFMTYPQIQFLGSAVSLDEGDALFSIWRLAWIAHQLPRDPLNLFDANIFHPEPGTLAFSDATVVPGLMAAPLLWLGVHQLTVYNIIFLSGFALSGAAMFLLVRSLTRHTGAALVAGFVFAFLPYRFMHYAHLELQMAQWMPLCLWAFHRTIRTGRLRDGLLTGLFLALQTLSSWYYGIFLFTFLVPVGAAAFVGAGARRVMRQLRALAAGGALAAVLIVPMALPYFAARQSVGERPVFEIEFYSATPRNYLAAHPRNVFFGPLTAHWGGQERELFMGLAVPLVALVGLWPPLSIARIAYALGLVTAFELSLGFNGLLYPWFHAYLLPYRGLRVPARMAMIVGLSLAVLAGYGVARISRRARSRHASIAVVLLITVVIGLEYRSVPTLKKVWTGPSPVYDALPERAPTVLLELPLVAPDIAFEPIYMYFSTFHWKPLVNGYSGFSPPSYQHLLRLIETFPDDKSLSLLRQRGVTHVIVHGLLYDPKDYEAVVARLDRCEQLEKVTAVKWQRRETRLYRVLEQGAFRTTRAE
jgi:hypothetical protein